MMMSRHPIVKWAQQPDTLYITIDLPDAEDVKLKLEPEGKFLFSATTGKEKTPYEVDLDLYDKIDVNESKVRIGLRNIRYLMKKDESKWWSRLIKQEGKPPVFLKVDWDKWVDEDEESDAQGSGNDMDFGDLDNSNFNTGGGDDTLGDEFDDSSDTEDLNVEGAPSTARHDTSSLVSRMTISEVTHGGVNVMDIHQRLHSIRMSAATEICEQIEEIITKHSLKTILSKKEDLGKMLDELQKYGIDSSFLRDKVKNLMTSASHYDAARLMCLQKAPSGTCDERLTVIESEITKSFTLHQVDINHRQKAITSLESLKKEQQKLEEIIASTNLNLQLHDKKLADLEEEKTRIKETPELTIEELEEVKRLKDIFEEQRNSFKGLIWV